MVSIQIGAAIATSLFVTIGPAGAATLRLTIAAVVLATFVRLRPSNFTRRQAKAVILLGVALGGLNMMFYQAISSLPLGTVVALQFLGPLGLAASMSRRRREWLWVVLAVGGVAALADGHAQGGLSWQGILWASGSGVAWAGYILAGSSVARSMPPQVGLAGASLVAALLSLPFGAASVVKNSIDWEMWVLGAAIALMASIIPYSLEMYALKRLPGNVFAVLVALEPAAGAIVGAVALGQTLDVASALAVAAIVAAGIGAVSTRGSSPAAAKQRPSADIVEMKAP